MKEIIKKLNDLYIIQRSHYLIQYKRGYTQYRKGDILPSGKKALSLLDWQFENHLNGIYTVGTFAKEFTKFITFDIDYSELYTAKIVAYKVSKTLSEVGIYDHYISYSGNKGYHIDIFIEDLITVQKAKEFFAYILHKSEIESDKTGQIEFRPTKTLGVKLPLGVHQFNNRYCGFCLIEDGLRVMSKEESQQYLQTIKKIKREAILNILNDEEELEFETPLLEKTEIAIAPHRTLKNEESGEDYSIDTAQNLLINGMEIQGTRHKSLFKIALYLKYMELTPEECVERLCEWMEWQNSSLYTSPSQEIQKDIEEIVRDIFQKDYQINHERKSLEVSLEEIKWIIENCEGKNTKLIAYAFLIHSKRWADKNGIFWFTGNDIRIATNLAMSTIRTQIEQLKEIGMIEIIERNRVQKGKGLMHKLPNLYRISLIDHIENHSEHIVINKDSTFQSSVRGFYCEDEIKKTIKRGQYDTLFKDKLEKRKEETGIKKRVKIKRTKSAGGV